jgi:ubiquinone/menaquinone biosynthesis C-methylase UbiE
MTVSRRADYEAIAANYDRRYDQNDYAGVEEAVAGFVMALAGPVLEVGCGTGHWLRSLAAKGVRATGIDAAANMLARARLHDAGAALVRGTAEHLPFTGEGFAGVLCVNALHHFPDKPAFMREARRVLRRGGRFMTIGLDPHTGVDRWCIYDYFEPAFAIDLRRYPAAGTIRAWMRDVGLADGVTREIQHRPVQMPARRAIEEGRLQKTWTSQLGVLTDEEYERGLARIRADIESADARGETLLLTADLRLYATTGVAQD